MSRERAVVSIGTPLVTLPKRKKRYILAQIMTVSQIHVLVKNNVNLDIEFVS